MPKTKKLNKESSFEDITQECIETYYLPAYVGQKDLSQDKSQVNRVFHGGVHAARTAMLVEVFLYLYKKYKPELVPPLSADDIKLLKLAAVYHDSANTSENHGNPEKHVNNFKKDMKELNYTDEEIEPFAQAMLNKDPKDKTVSKSFFAKIIHDADCLEILRVFGADNYNKEYLDAFQDLQSLPQFNIELDQIIANHIQTIDYIEGDCTGANSLHLHCEFSKNCYQALRLLLEQIMLAEINLYAAQRNRVIDLSKIDRSQFTLIDLFNREHSPLIKQLIEHSSMPLGMPETKEDKASYLYKHGGLLARIILDPANINTELDTLNANVCALQKASIIAPEQMIRYLSDQKELVFTPSGFIWRPCTLIENQIPITLFSGQGVGILIDPTPGQGTFLSNFYKENIVSTLAATGRLNYFPPKTGRKERGSLYNLREKMHEQNRRRIGAEPDYNGHYYGKATLSHSEILGTYQAQSVVGVFISSLDASSLEAAFFMQAKLGMPYRPIYFYSPTKGLHLLSSEDIALHLKPLPQSAAAAVTANENLSLEERQQIQEIIDIFKQSETAQQISIQQIPEDLQTVYLHNPFKYVFSHPNNPFLTYQCYVKNGQPVMEMHLPNGKVIDQAIDILPQIAQVYFEQATQRLHTHIRQDEIQEALDRIGIQDLDCRLVNVNRKSSLALSFHVAPGFEKMAVQQTLKDVLRIGAVKDFDDNFLQRDYPGYQSDTNQVIVSVGELQSIDTFIKCLSRVALENQLSTPSVDEYGIVEKETLYEFGTPENNIIQLDNDRSFELETPRNNNILFDDGPFYKLNL